MINLKTGKRFDGTDGVPMTRGGFLKGILASGIAPSVTLGAIGLAGRADGGSARGMMRGVGARMETMRKKTFEHYLQSHGTEYIDSLVPARTKLRVYAEFEITEPQYDTALCGAKGYYNNRLVPFAMFFQHDPPYAQFVFKSGAENYDIARISTNKKYVLDATASTTLSCTVNGVTSTSAGGSVNTGTTLRIFAREWNGNINSFSKVKLYAMKIWLDDVLQRDYIPKIVNNVGYLFDQEHPTGGPSGNGLYGNLGTGAFTWG